MDTCHREQRRDELEGEMLDAYISTLDFDWRRYGIDGLTAEGEREYADIKRTLSGTIMHSCPHDETYSIDGRGEEVYCLDCGTFLT